MENSLRLLRSFSLRRLSIIGLSALGVATVSVQAAPDFDASLVGRIGIGLGWSSDLGLHVYDTSPYEWADGSPVTVAASAVRDGRLVEGELTQSAPYVLQGQYWAASWSGWANIPEPGLYGLSATATVSSAWFFSIPGQTNEENRATRFYYASQWNVTSPADIHPFFEAQFLVSPPLGGTATGSFTLGELASYGITGFPTTPSFAAGTHSLDRNAPGRMEFSYEIAFSTTPIDASVFVTNSVPDAGSSLALLVPVCGLMAVVARRQRTRAAS